MIHREREWYTCDRCGCKIEEDVSMAFSGKARGIRRIFADIFNKEETKNILEIRATTVKNRGYIADQYLTAKNILCMEIVEYYDCEKREIHLCGKCRKAFERFLSNE